MSLNIIQYNGGLFRFQIAAHQGCCGIDVPWSFVNHPTLTFEQCYKDSDASFKKNYPHAFNDYSADARLCRYLGGNGTFYTKLTTAKPLLDALVEWSIQHSTAQHLIFADKADGFLFGKLKDSLDTTYNKPQTWCTEVKFGNVLYQVECFVTQKKRNRASGNYLVTMTMVVHRE